MSYWGDYYARNRDAILAWHRAHYLSKREQRMAQMREYARANRDKLNKTKQEWRIRNRGDRLLAKKLGISLEEARRMK